jgi:hypothetical protein
MGENIPHCFLAIAEKNLSSRRTEAKGRIDNSFFSPQLGCPRNGDGTGKVGEEGREQMAYE